MEKNRQTKVIAIVALVVAIVGMSLGFAAFSNILTISSSATVTPNDEDFIIKAYGMSQEVLPTEFESKAFDSSLYNSTTLASPVLGGVIDDSNGPLDAAKASIDNGELTISNISVTFSEPNQHVAYPVIIKNEGEYDAYLDTASLEKYFNGVGPTKCTADTGTTVDLVNSACDSIYFYIEGTDSSQNNGLFDDVSSSYKVPAGDYIYFFVVISYDINASRADGPFTVQFEDISLNFSTAA